MRTKIISILIIIPALALFWLFFLKDDSLEKIPVSSVGEEPRKISEDSTESVINRLSEIGETLDKESVRQNIVGLWQSLDNSGYSVEFTAGGKMTERLDKSVVSGDWNLVSYEEGPNAIVGGISFSQEGVFLEQSLEEGKARFYYKVVQVDKDRLVTIYLHQAGILGFDRIR